MGKTGNRTSGKGKLVAKRTTRASPRTSKAKSTQQDSLNYRPYFAQIEVVPTRYTDEATLERLHLSQTVSTLFEKMGLSDFVNKRHLTYTELTKDFLATVEVLQEPDCRLTGKNGAIHFVVANEYHIVTFDDLANIFGLQKGFEMKYSRVQDPQQYWDAIGGTGRYNSGKVKAAQLRHPAVRYAHRVLANTFFARQFTNNVRTEEMHLLYTGLEGTTWRDVHMGSVLGHHLASYKQWAKEASTKLKVNVKRKKPTISIGGIITPILDFVGINLSKHKYTDGVRTIDEFYLYKCDILAGRVHDKVAYKLELPNTQKVMVLLPNWSITTANVDRRLQFTPSSEYHFVQSPNNMLVPITSTLGVTSDNGSDGESQNEDDCEDPTTSTAAPSFTLPPLITQAKSKMDKWTFEVATQQQEQLNYMRKQMETTQGELAEVKAHMSCQGKVIRQLKRLVKAMQPSTPKRKLVASSHPEVIIPEPTRYSSVDPLNPSRYTNHGDPVPREYPSLEDDDDTPFTFQRQRSRSPRSPGVIPHL
ncbi:hypothetical protein ISN45_Aa03g022400 [Arabidopsis thaliana x Arabidopsis arenosa]|uniref:Arabidopsis retrotransposon Orf1 C-terminal domain-containing protein n=2 Tax=Arabidopsis TaxID=3701 RepID=A0A8T2B9N6_ARASU|nr:hypothetical protein ISN45_Aa03g022400 [Arabidopsis thaliana x Arabidopsis arenosa]KAG7582706.1 hypothetical protein ISN44_As08g022780 [Arabidopsis suecica]KAG7582707.1 hypothetical protein ISN44_As08g022780 [Arabidopsis suecica]